MQIDDRDSQSYGYLFGGPYNKDYTILGVHIGVPVFRETTMSFWKHPSESNRDLPQPWSRLECGLQGQSVHSTSKWQTRAKARCLRSSGQYVALDPE